MEPLQDQLSVNTKDMANESYAVNQDKRKYLEAIKLRKQNLYAPTNCPIALKVKFKAPSLLLFFFSLNLFSPKLDLAATGSAVSEVFSIQRFSKLRTSFSHVSIVVVNTSW